MHDALADPASAADIPLSPTFGETARSGKGYGEISGGPPPATSTKSLA